MTMTMELQDRSSRWWLIGSLALNLFFIGTIGALAVRHVVAPSQPAATERPRTALARIERLATPLPAADAEKLRAAFRAREAAAEGGRDAMNRAFERVQAALRAEPFDAAQLRAAFGDVRAARPAYEQAMQDIIATAAAGMSREGRNRLSEWPSPSRTGTNTR
jgi:uncharacterized membrane protein